MEGTVNGTDKKYERLKGILRDMGTVLIAYSGGTDSAFLAAAAHEVLGRNTIAVMAHSPLIPALETAAADELAASLGLRYEFFESNELMLEGFTANPPDRCYRCRNALFASLAPIAGREGMEWIADGSNSDDLNDRRPGMQAAREAGVRSPMREAGMTKGDIRLLSHKMGLPTWNKHASPCLASRVPYGTPISKDVLDKIASGEQYLRTLVQGQVRLRHHGDIARIEVEPHDMHILLQDEVRAGLLERLRSLDYIYVTLDLDGFRSGSLNEVLDSTEVRKGEHR